MPEEHARELVIDLFIKHELEELAHKLAGNLKHVAAGCIAGFLVTCLVCVTIEVSLLNGMSGRPALSHKWDA